MKNKTKIGNISEMKEKMCKIRLSLEMALLFNIEGGVWPNTWRDTGLIFEIKIRSEINNKIKRAIIKLK